MSEHTRNPQSIQVEIGELVLHGFAPGDRYVIAAAVEQELTRLITEHAAPALWQQGAAQDRVDAGVLRQRPAAVATPVGIQVAGQLFQALGRDNP
ncbi:MAG: hypothetical protein IPK16_14775 [Anaerolineales bacterium]|nr:hypothetical protein [Anaerolineales bacterium]